MRSRKLPSLKSPPSLSLMDDLETQRRNSMLFKGHAESLSARWLQFAWTCDPAPAYINTVERLTDTGGLCRKLVDSRLFLTSVWTDPLTSHPVTPVRDNARSRPRRPLPPPRPCNQWKAGGGGLRARGEGGECGTAVEVVQLPKRRCWGSSGAPRAGFKTHIWHVKKW